MQAVKSLFIFLMGAASVIGFVILTSYTDPDQPNSPNPEQPITTEKPQTTQTDNDPVQTINVPSVPEEVVFADEKLPDHFDARERFDREFLSMCFWHSKMIATMKLANRYFPIIEPILKENGVPDDIKYLAVTESNLRNATSPAGAKGIWQFMKGTARDYGLVVNSEIDERYHLVKSTEAACKYLNKSKKRFGSWLLAAASYNMGSARLETRVKDQQADKYFDLYLNPETSRYVPRMMAAKEVMSNPEKYGFKIAEKDLYPAFPEHKLVRVDGAVDSWSDFAKSHDISYRMLKVLNPWIISTKLTNSSGHVFEVMIPTKE